MNDGSVPGTPGAPPATRSRAVFTGESGAFRGLVTRGALLELVTFGFYRFWLTTNIRRHLWTHSSAGGDALEYTGTGRELLIGFLFALAILVPIYLAYFLLGIEAERWQAFAGIPFGLLYYGFWQFAVYRARRYRLTRTLWRGVRFWMTGAGTAYALRAFGWTALTVVTLGLAYPWRAAALERYKMSHTFYGDLPGRFEGKGWDFFKLGWWMWAMALAPIAGFGVIMAVATPSTAPVRTHARPLTQLQFSPHDQFFGTSSDRRSDTPVIFTPPQTPYVLPLPAKQGDATPRPVPKQAPMQGVPAFFVLISIVSFLSLPFPFVYGVFKATEWKWWVQGLRLGGVRFDCDLTRAALVANIWKMIGVALLVSIAVSIVIGVIGFLIFKLAPGFFFTLSDSGKTTPSSGAFVTAVISYLAVLFALSVVWRIYMVQRIWKLVVSSISLENLVAADHVVAKGEAASALGEGLVDSLDVAGF